MKKMRIIFLGCQDYNNWVVQEGKTCASTQTCPGNECGATGLPLIFSHIANVYCVLGTKSRMSYPHSPPSDWALQQRSNSIQSLQDYGRDLLLVPACYISGSSGGHQCTHPETVKQMQ